MDAGWVTWAVPVLAVAAGYFALGLTGFGSALVAMPLLATAMPLAQAVPLVLALDIVALLVFGSLNLRQVRWAELRVLLPAAAAGAVAAAAVLRLLPMPSAPLRVALGLYVAWVGLAGLRGRAAFGGGLPAAERGMLAGAVETWFGTSGPVLAAGLVHRLADTQALRATLGMAILGTAVVALATYAAGAAPDAMAWGRAAALAPLAMAATAIGHRLAGRWDGQTVRRGIFALLVASGLGLCLGAFVAG